MLRYAGLRFDPNGEGAAAPPSSEANPADAAASVQGSAGEGAGTGSPAAGSLAADGGQPNTTPAEQNTINWQERARSFQGRADRAEAELQRVRQALAAEQPQGNVGDEPLTQAGLAAFLDRRGAIDRVLAAVPQQYAYAHPEITRRAYEYESPEALIAALEDSHAAETAYRERIRQEIIAEAGGAPAPAGGDPRPPVNAGQNGAAGAGPPTVQQLAKMNQAELDAVEKLYPGHLDGAVKAIEQDAIFTGS